jgi:hypothetical protein
MLVMDCDRHAAILPSRDDRSERAKTVQPKYPEKLFPDNRS